MTVADIIDTYWNLRIGQPQEGTRGVIAVDQVDEPLAARFHHRTAFGEFTQKHRPPRPVNSPKSGNDPACTERDGLGLEEDSRGFAERFGG